MSNEKDGTVVPPPDAIDDHDSDVVTNVQGLSSIANADDDEEIVTKVKPLDDHATTQVKEPPTQRLPPRLPGVPAAVAELAPEPEPEPVAAEEEEVETVDDLALHPRVEPARDHPPSPWCAI